jgi:hypothetical protein
MKLSQKIMDFNTEANVFVKYITDPPTALRLNVASTQVTAAQTHLTDWTPKFVKYTDPNTHTEISVKGIQLEYEAFHPFILGLKKQIKNNQAVTLIEDDYKNLYIHEDAGRRAHVPRPVISPENDLVLQTHLRAQIFAHSPLPEEKTYIKLPADVEKIGRKLCITKVDDPEPDLSKYQNLESVGATTFDIIFSPDNLNAKAWVRTYYMNPRGEEGPISNAISFVIN